MKWVIWDTSHKSERTQSVCGHELTPNRCWLKTEHNASYLHLFCCADETFMKTFCSWILTCDIADVSECTFCMEFPSKMTHTQWQRRERASQASNWFDLFEIVMGECWGVYLRDVNWAWKTICNTILGCHCNESNTIREASTMKILKTIDVMQKNNKLFVSVYFVGAVVAVDCRLHVYWMQDSIEWNMHKSATETHTSAAKHTHNINTPDSNEKDNFFPYYCYFCCRRCFFFFVIVYNFILINST